LDDLFLYQGTTLAVPQLLEIFPCFLAAASISPQRAFRRSEHFAAASISPQRAFRRSEHFAAASISPQRALAPQGCSAWRPGRVLSHLARKTIRAAG
jgi:hypothetical protein